MIRFMGPDMINHFTDDPSNKFHQFFGVVWSAGKFSGIDTKISLLDFNRRICPLM
jgi:hypothetical protein